MQIERRGGAYDDDMVVMKGAQLTMSVSSVTEVEKQKREDDVRVNKSGEST